MNYITPEQAGISSENIREYIEMLENNRLTTHSVIMMKGNDIFFEKYIEPFHKDFLHRMYSVTKSFVTLAVGFAMQDGLLKLDDKISEYFPEEMKNQHDENMQNQTIRHMLMMSTAKTPVDWFKERTDDRVRFYFENQGYSRPSGTTYEYDSSGSFVLCALVERLTGKSFIDYLREKLFDKIGVSKEAYCLKCPGGHSWGDSALLCTSLDLLKTARFVMNKGMWNGERILDAEFIEEAVSKRIDNGKIGDYEHDSFGYGYLFWRTFDNSYFFNGMGCQFAICVPDKELIFVYNGDNQGKQHAKKEIIDNFFNLIARKISVTPLPENPVNQKELKEYTDTLKLATAKGEKTHKLVEQINGITYEMSENPMGITKIKFVFGDGKGKMEYTNEQGDKTLYFGMCENEYSKFPQEGYSDEIGSQYAPGNYYNCAVSAAWAEPNKLFIKVQIIDKYFGTLDINVSFRDEFIGVYMQKCAEDFLDEYSGFAGGKMM